MLNCKEVSYLVSESLERRLPLRLRMGVHLHLMMCGMCRAYKRQVVLMRTLIRLAARADETDCAEAVLSPETRERITKVLADTAQETDR